MPTKAQGHRSADMEATQWVPHFCQQQRHPGPDKPKERTCAVPWTVSVPLCSDSPGEDTEWSKKRGSCNLLKDVKMSLGRLN